MGCAAGGEADVKVGAQRGQRHFAKAREKQRLRIVKRLVECGVHGLFDEASRRLRSIADREQRGAAERAVDVAQRDLGQVAGKRPPAAMPLFRSDIALIAKASQDAPDHNGIGVHRLGQNLRRRWSTLLRQVQQDVENA